MSPAPIPPTIHVGSQGVFVKQWQRIVGAADDGNFGPITEALTKRWQGEHGLTVDGIVGPITWTKALTADTHPPPPPADGPYLYVPARYFYPGKMQTVDWVVLHSTEGAEKYGSAMAIAQWFRGKDAPQASAHYVVDPGAIIQCVHETDGAWAVGSSNLCSVSIEICGTARQTAEQWHDELSTAILHNAAKLAAEICARHDVPVQWCGADALARSERGITTHKLLNDVFFKGPKSKAHWDPGPNFPAVEFIEAVRSFST